MTLPARHVPDLLDRLQRSDPGRPRLTWYGDPGERVELSARVLANWVAKTANLLVEEFDAAPGTTIALALPPAHWKTLILGLAISATGAVTVDAGTANADVRITADPAPGADLVVALAPLARRHEQEVGDALDHAAIITGYDDVFVPVTPDTELLGRASSARPGQRRLITADQPDPLAVLVSLLLADGSLVVAPAKADLARIAAQEGADQDGAVHDG